MASGTKSPFTRVGTIGEALFEAELAKRGIYAQKMSVLFDYDFMTTTNKRVEVKTAKPTNGTKLHKGKVYKSIQWQFRNYDNGNLPVQEQAGRKRECDLYAFICLNEQETLEMTAIVPGNIVSGKLQIYISKKPTTPLAEFKERWELLN